MKSFLKYVFATIVGLLIFSVLWVLLFFAMIGVAMSSSKNTAPISENTVFELELKGILVERAEEDIWTSIAAEMNSSQRQIALDDIVESIEKAAGEDKIKGIYLKIGNLSASMASLQQIYRCLGQFKKSGKFIIAYGDYYGNGTYYLASIADKVYLNPEGTLALSGLQASTMFYKNLLDKLGVDMQIFKVGTFKSAVEPFTQTSMSEANRLQLTAYINSLWKEITTSVAQNRATTVDNINAFADSGLFFGEAMETVKYKLIDSLVYQSDMDSIIKALTVKDYHTASLDDIKNVSSKHKSRSKNKIAVLYAVGEIDGSDERSGINSQKIVDELIDLADDDKIKAVVLRVNSPGGSAFGSEQIWQAVGKVKARKPVVVSMGDYAASGGYYISCIADRIFAEPTTLTGSIGIFGMFPNVKGLFDKIGLSFESVKTNKLSDFGATYRPMAAEEKVLLQKYIEKGYDLFTKRCADGRGMSQDSIKKIAEGRIYSGSDALQLGLVDELGGLNEAIAFAAKQAKVDEYSIKNYPAVKTVMEQLTEMFSTSVRTKLLQIALGDQYKLYDAVQKSQNTVGIKTLMPYTIEVK